MAMATNWTLLKYSGVDLNPYKLSNILDWLRGTKCRDVRKLRKQFKLTNREAEYIMERWLRSLEVEEEFKERDRKMRMVTIQNR